MFLSKERVFHVVKLRNKDFGITRFLSALGDLENSTRWIWNVYKALNPPPASTIVMSDVWEKHVIRILHNLFSGHSEL